MRKVTAQIYGRKYIFETDIEEDFLNGLIQTFSKKKGSTNTAKFF